MTMLRRVFHAAPSSSSSGLVVGSASIMAGTANKWHSTSNRHLFLFCVHYYKHHKYSTSSTTRASSAEERKKVSDPLRILFCGADEFSCASLQALHDEHKRQQQDGDSALISSIDVVVRPGKRTGRGLKVIREVPLKKLAQQLGLPVHERDTFTGWRMPHHLDEEPINLIIAVSFGLFVPPRLLRAAKYGGLNVHPSLLPDLKGPAPLHYALLSRRPFTGVSLQTLSETAFDEGTILARDPPLSSSSPSLPSSYFASGPSSKANREPEPPEGEGSQDESHGIPIPPGCTVSQLRDLLAGRGAALLVGALRAGLHVPPVEPLPLPPPLSGVLPPPLGKQGAVECLLLRAPKLKPADRQVRWLALASASAEGGASGTGTGTGTGNGTGKAWDASEMELRARVLGPLWTRVEVRSGSGVSVVRRVILEDVGELPLAGGSEAAAAKMGTEAEAEARMVTWVQEEEPDGGGVKGGDAKRQVEVKTRVVRDGDAVIVFMPSDGSCVRIGKVKVEGGTAIPAGVALTTIFGE